MESNNNNIEMILNSLDMTNENVLQAEILTPNLDNSNSTINNIKNYINEKYDQTAISHLKNQIIPEIKDIFKNQLTNGSQVNDLQKHNAFLLNEVYFLREEVREKSYLIRTLNQRIIKPENRCECRLSNNKEHYMKSNPLIPCENSNFEVPLSENQLESIRHSGNITLRNRKKDNGVENPVTPLISLEPLDHTQVETPPDVTSCTFDPDLSLILTENQNVDTVSTRTKHVNKNLINGNDKDKNEKEGDTGKQEEETKKKTEKEELPDVDETKKEKDKGNLIENARNNNEKSKTQYNSDEKSQKHVIILGDSIVKHLNGWEMTRKLKNCKVKVMSFSGATADCMTDYMKPSLRENPNHFILNVGTNDLISNNSAKCIAESIIEKAVYLKNDKHDVSISSIVLRKDNLKDKVDEVSNN